MKAADIGAITTTTVGLVTSGTGAAANVMAAEWTYVVAKEPLHIAIGISDGAMSQATIAQTGEFGVTLCDESQAGLAALVGSFSVSEIDKLSCERLAMVPPTIIKTPMVAGGLLRAECKVVASLTLPGYLLLIGEAVAWTSDDGQLQRPLVKHGGMYRLGERIQRTEVYVAAAAAESGVLVAVMSPQQIDELPWVVDLLDDAGVVLKSCQVHFTLGVDMSEIAWDGADVEAVEVRHSSGAIGRALIRGRASN